MATKAPSKNIVDGFPALKKLGFATGKRVVPFVQQLEWTDCGAASLCMVMAYYGREAKLAEVREAMGIGRDGVSAKSILDTNKDIAVAVAKAASPITDKVLDRKAKTAKTTDLERQQ